MLGKSYALAGLSSALNLVFWLGNDRISRVFYCIFIEGSILNMKSENSSQLQTLKTLLDD